MISFNYLRGLEDTQSLLWVTFVCKLVYLKHHIFNGMTYFL